MPVLPQFPLESVLFPTMVLPLHVFEPRYRELIAEALEADEAFGVVLIERGSEVGGTDTRSNFGTEAKIVKAERFVDGRWSVIAVGTRRFEVTKWLEDSPYPQAEVRYIDEPAESCSDSGLKVVASKFSCLMALASEAGVDDGNVPTTFADPAIASYQMAALAPLNMIDKHELLAERSTPNRLALLGGHLDSALEVMRFKLGADPNFGD